MGTINQSWVAGENIAPRLIVRQDTASPRQMLKATLGHYPIGVIQEGTVYAPIPEVTTQYAALSGNQARVYGEGEECEIDVGTIAITTGERIAPDANSKAQPAIHGFPIVGIALDNGAASGKVRCRVQYPVLENKQGEVLVKTQAASPYTVQLRDLGKTFMNTGASGAVSFALPAAVVGMEVFARVDAAQQLQLDPNGTEQICLPSTGVPGAAGKYLVADLPNEFVHLKCNETGIWDVVTYTGTWTAEA